ncbi:MAG: hypothetical protein ABSG42_08080, partial [Nitrospirota bacterium]
MKQGLLLSIFFIFLLISPIICRAAEIWSLDNTAKAKVTANLVYVDPATGETVTVKYKGAVTVTIGRDKDNNHLVFLRLCPASGQSDFSIKAAMLGAGVTRGSETEFSATLDDGVEGEAGLETDIEDSESGMSMTGDNIMASTAEGSYKLLSGGDISLDVAFTVMGLLTKSGVG